MSPRCSKTGAQIACRFIVDARLSTVSHKDPVCTSQTTNIMPRFKGENDAMYSIAFISDGRELPAIQESASGKHWIVARPGSQYAIQVTAQANFKTWRGQTARESNFLST
eukprot:TRINITY_DN12477_c1_g1_i9.p2 TRINITY_DN12477_c1_g1~~TRINITY_DN12477_c1_g1_i9.p2  ORF type:complete len:110 (+),score=8.68 TRINITY_DN12477_c1_g1_i9:915-1244(+)